MLLMLRLLTIISLLSISIFAKSSNSIDDMVLEYEKNRIAQNKLYKLKSIDIYFKQEIPIKGWFGYVFNLKLLINDKVMDIKDTLFTNGTAIAQDLKQLKNGKSYKEFLSKKLSSSYYNDEHFIAGNKEAKNKIVLFSDPLCPFCLDYVPEVIEYVKKHNKNIALYYYHYPLLKLHPASNIVTKAMVVASNIGISNVISKIYGANFDGKFDVDETNNQKILDEINNVLNTNITLDQVVSEDIESVLKNDRKLAKDIFIKGTPTIYINGYVDNSRIKFKNIK